MNTVCEINKCNGCMACTDVCPKDCITIQDDIYYYNALKDEKLCIGCHLCEKVCPRIHEADKEKPIMWHQGWAETEIRNGSSSGGAASAIIKNFIQQGGYVASCLFEDGAFIFDITNDLHRAKQFAGSKYVKSNPKGIYKKVESRLKTNKVLFVGLPCQVAGLKNYVRNQEKLYTIDLICHGTPSPQLLEKHLKEHSIDINDIKEIKFRNSINFGLFIDRKKICPEGMDDYMMAFLAAVDYTENCYSCDYSTFERVSDITLGDSWGTEYEKEEQNGVSLILVQTEKGKELLENADLCLKDVDIENAIEQNTQLRHPSELSPERALFLDNVVSGKRFSFATFLIFKKKVMKRNIKKVLVKLHLWNP